MEYLNLGQIQRKGELRQSKKLYHQWQSCCRSRDLSGDVSCRRRKQSQGKTLMRVLESRDKLGLDWRRQKGKRNFYWILLLLKRNTSGFD